MNLIKTLLIVFGLIVMFSACGGSSSGKGTAANLVIPKLEVKVHGSEGNNPEVLLPLLIWPSFEYKRLAWNHKTKVEHCLITESEGVEINIGSKVEVLDEARCLYVRLNSVEGAPKNYSTGIMRIRVVETGEEGWIWSKAVDLKE